MFQATKCPPPSQVLTVLLSLSDVWSCGYLLHTLLISDNGDVVNSAALDDRCTDVPCMTQGTFAEGPFSVSDSKGKGALEPSRLQS